MLNSGSKLSKRGRVSVFQLVNSEDRFSVTGDPVVDGQREQLVFPN